MNATEIAWLLFFDSLLEAMIVPIHEPYVYDSLHYFPHLQPWQRVVTALAGSVTGAMINYMLGSILRSAIEFVPKPVRQMQHDVARFCLSRWSLLLPLTAAIPLLGAWATVFSGIIRMSLPRYVIAVFISYAAYYGMHG